MNYKLKAVRVPNFDMVGDEHYGDKPYGVVLDVYDTDDNFIENGTEWSYFANETEAEDYCRVFNSMNGDIIKNNELIADFMGFKKDSDQLYLIDDYDIRGEEEYQATYVSEMKFHFSWDWLIKVIEKIYNDFSIDDERVLLIRDALAEADFDNAYKNVVEFIKSKL